MNNLEKIEEILKSDPEMQKKLAVETKRLMDSGEKDMKAISSKAAKAVFGVDLTDAELDQVVNATQELDLDAMEKVCGGASTTEIVEKTGLMAVGGAATGGAIGLIGGPVGAAFGPRERVDQDQICGSCDRRR